MQNKIIKILIVDDIEDNRLIIKKICRKLDDVELLEAANGKEAVETTREHEPHIILMDIMMPIMDGFEASTIIKSEYPEVHIIVVTALTDDETEKNFLKLGVDGYLKKPLARGVLKVKLEGLIATLHIKNGTSAILSTKHTLNPFNKNIRKMKTLFDIENEDDMMNMGIWLSDYYAKRNAVTTMNFDFSLDFIYQFLKNQIKSGVTTNILVEEDFNDVYLNLVTQNEINSESLNISIEERIRENLVIQNGILHLKIKMKYDYQPEALMAENMMKNLLASMEYSDAELSDIGQESFTDSSFGGDIYEDKISAIDFISSIEVENLRAVEALTHIENKFALLLDTLENTKALSLLEKITDEVITQYAAAINKIYEFHTLGYGISTLAIFLKTTDREQVGKNITRVHSILLSIYQDLVSWRREIFIEKRASDIHHYDSSILSSCMQIDSAIKFKSDETD